MQSREVICIDSGTSDDEELEKEVEHIVVPDNLSSYLCPIGRDLMHDPVTCADGHSYEHQNIERWLMTSNKSPLALLPLMLCPVMLRSPKIVDNRASFFPLVPLVWRRGH